MEARTSSRTGLVGGFLATLGRLLLIGAFTGVETIALVVWLGFVRDAPVASQATAIGLGVLAVGLLVEHFFTDQAVNGPNLSFPLGKVVAFSASETVLWALWLVIADAIGGVDGLLIAGVVLAVLLVPQHTVEDSVLRGRGLLSNLVDLGTVGFSIVEAAGATAWLVLVLRGDLVEPLVASTVLMDVDPATIGVGALAVALFAEHVLGVSFSLRA